jgi:transcriptional regulator with XRE-family HTH domain
LTIIQGTVRVRLASKLGPSSRHKQFPLKIKSLGDALLVARRKAGFTYAQLAGKTGIQVHWLRRWELDLCEPSRENWNTLRKFLRLPPTTILTISQTNLVKLPTKTIGEELLKCRTARKLLIKQVAARLGFGNAAKEAATAFVYHGDKRSSVSWQLSAMLPQSQNCLETQLFCHSLSHPRYFFHLRH